MDGIRLELVWPILGAVIAGGAVGFEREIRARAAGLRTHVLVSLASALLMLAAHRQMEWAGPAMPEEIVRIDPVRMAHGILTGVGFLCGGVIFKEGLSVYGLTTAASLWITSALGMLFGVGLYGLAAGGTALTLIVLSVFRLFDRWVPAQAQTDAVFRFRAAQAPTEAELCEMLRPLGLKTAGVSHRLIQGGEVVEYAAVIRSTGKLATDRLAQALRQDGRTLEYVLEPRNA